MIMMVIFLTAISSFLLLIFWGRRQIYMRSLGAWLISPHAVQGFSFSEAGRSINSEERKVKVMDEGTDDLYYDGDSLPDAGTGEDAGTYEDAGNAGIDDGGSDPDLSDIIKDALDSYFAPDTGESTDTENGKGTETGAEEENGSETENDSEADSVDSETSEPETVLFDSEVLNEIRDILREHADSTDVFMSGLTVSGNVIEVSLDPGSSALITDISEKQAETMDMLDGMTSTVFLVFFVLVFDLLHRSAKRIIKNLTGGEKNGTNP